MAHRSFHVGDPIIFSMEKSSRRPGPRARGVHPAEHGDLYWYRVDKLWVVADVCRDGRLVLRTRTGKVHYVDPDSPRLRHAKWWERWLNRARFPRVGG